MCIAGIYMNFSGAGNHRLATAKILHGRKHMATMGVAKPPRIFKFNISCRIQKLNMGFQGMP